MATQREKSWRGAVVAQHAALAAPELGFELGQVDGDRPGRGVGLDAKIEPVAGLDASMVILVFVAQVWGAPGPEGKRERVVGVRAPGQDGAARWPVQEPGDLSAGHPGNGGSEIDQAAGGAR